jgi:hypothetical protein
MFLLKFGNDTEVLTVNGVELQIAIVVPSTSKNITARVTLPVSSKVPDLALVVPNPGTASGPMNAQSDPFHIFSVLTGVLNHRAPADGSTGAISDTEADPTIAHFVPS